VRKRWEMREEGIRSAGGAAHPPRSKITKLFTLASVKGEASLSLSLFDPLRTLARKLFNP
jgi:hypothetical protein